jgi:hypothetical protein
MGHPTNYPNERTRRRGSTGQRFSTLDEERLASMADEGGVSGAMMEIEDCAERSRLQQALQRPGLFTRPRVAVALALAALGVLVIGLRRSWV